MPEYLNLLAARLAGTAPLLQPRLPSRFEPPARQPDLEGSLPGLTKSPWLAEEQAEETAPAPASVQSPIIPKSDRATTPIEQASQPESKPHARSTGPQVTAQATAVPGPAIPRVTALPRVEPARPDFRTQETPGPAVQPVPEIPWTETPRAQKAVEVRIARASQTIESTPGMPPYRPEAVIQQPRPKPASPQVEPASLQTPRVPPAVQSPGTFRPKASDPQATPPGQPTTIQVTIGRIEVHAAPPPAATGSRKSRSTPLMSLEDYLKQRNGEKR
jgi:hypothetical protein